MNDTITPVEELEPITRPETEQPVAEAPAPVKTLDSIVQSIRLDALFDSLKYVLRSDTGHDGE